MKLFRVTLILASMVFFREASAAYLTYAEWDSLPAPTRALYIAGLFDGLTTIATNDWEPITRHYDKCIEKAKLTNDQLAENVLAYGHSRPQFHAKPVAGAMINYLVEVCGAPPQACVASPAAAPKP
jgi:hypothetical protein